MTLTTRKLARIFRGGIASDAFEFNHSNIDTKELSINVIDNLLDASKITLDEYRALAASYNVEPPKIKTAQEAARMHGTEWFEIVKAGCPNARIVDWLEPRVKRSVGLAGSVDGTSPKFGHGDPSNPNILIGGEETFTLIDWDSARFSTLGPEAYIAYTTHLTDFMKPYREALIQHVASKLGISAKELGEKVHRYRYFTEVFDVNWAAMMMAKVSTGEIEGDLDEFRRIATERIQIYDASFGTS